MNALAPRLRHLPVLEQRPRTRGECERQARPCPWVGCRYHLALHVTEQGKLFIAEDWDDGRATCALDLADQGEHNLAEVGQVLGVTRERARQLYVVAALRLRVRFGPHWASALSLLLEEG